MWKTSSESWSGRSPRTTRDRGSGATLNPSVSCVPGHLPPTDDDSFRFRTLRCARWSVVRTAPAVPLPGREAVCYDTENVEATRR